VTNLLQNVPCTPRFFKTRCTLNKRECLLWGLSQNYQFPRWRQWQWQWQDYWVCCTTGRCLDSGRCGAMHAACVNGGQWRVGLWDIVVCHHAYIGHAPAVVPANRSSGSAYYSRPVDRHCPLVSSRRAGLTAITRWPTGGDKSLTLTALSLRRWLGQWEMDDEPAA